MKQISLFESVHWQVSDLTRHIRQILETDEILQSVWVQGEISNLSRPASGHLYFTLKDSSASLRAVMWKTDAGRNRFDLRDGMLLEAHGRVGVYEASGQYQLYVDVLRPAGEGALFAEFLRLKSQLEAEGLFSEERKRPVPAFPRRIGVITSASGAALQDILNTLRRRNPLAEVLLATSTVQGVDAPFELVAALKRLALQKPLPDVVLLARGGGSLEDLWAFNDEQLVREIVNFPAPVISGVGHETDFTLADFAADLRAPTPTAAAELATEITLSDLSLSLRGQAERLRETLTASLRHGREELKDMVEQMCFLSPERRILNLRQRLDDFSRRLARGVAHRQALQFSQVQGVERRLQALNPMSVLRRGYAVVTKSADASLVHSVGQTQGGDGLRIRVSDGSFNVQVSKDKRESV